MHHRKNARFGVAVLAIALALVSMAGCAPAQKAAPAAAPAATGAAYPMTITDDAGRAVTIDGEPKRIVSLAPANTEICYSLGLLDRVVGVTTYDDYPQQVTSIAKMGDFTTPNMEAVAAAKPDVVLVTGGVQADVIAKLEGVGAKVVVVDPKDLKGVFTAIRAIARVAGVSAKGEQVVSKMEADLAQITAKVGSAPRVSAFVEIGWNPLFTAGTGTLIDDLITSAGGRNVVTQKDYVGYSVEQLVKDRPEVYLGTLTSIGDAKALAARPGFALLPAVKAGRVYALDDNLVSRPGPRVVDGVRQIAAALHPDAFK
ncbi:MAG: cobalamin-binding protein [Coriobacteriia bacterium]|nr:cobalamin-binding protein [Coriobacteriia bacterium]